MDAKTPNIVDMLSKIQSAKNLIMRTHLIAESAIPIDADAEQMTDEGQELRDAFSTPSFMCYALYSNPYARMPLRAIVQWTAYCVFLKPASLRSRSSLMLDARRK